MIHYGKLTNSITRAQQETKSKQAKKKTLKETKINAIKFFNKRVYTLVL